MTEPELTVFWDEDDNAAIQGDDYTWTEDDFPYPVDKKHYVSVSKVAEKLRDAVTDEEGMIKTDNRGNHRRVEKLIKELQEADNQ